MRCRERRVNLWSERTWGCIHGGATDLEPLTTVLDAARAIGEDLDALIEAQQEVRDNAMPSPRLDARARTPA